MDEFDLIQTYLAPLAGPEGLGLQDDAACFKPPTGHDLVFTKDTMVEGVHFPKGRRGGDFAERLLRVNLSDLAAKGARPLGYLLSLALPNDIGEGVLEGFVKGLSDVQQSYDFALWGGDTVRIDGPMVITATLIGAVPTGGMVTRNGAKVGDDVWITGSVGDAALGCRYVLGQSLNFSPDGAALWAWEKAYLRPKPRLLLRKCLRAYANAAVDISDGLVADLGHIAKASGVGLEINANDLPLSSHTETWRKGQVDPMESLLSLISFGDDYEIGFTANPENRTEIIQAADALGMRITRCGACRSEQGISLIDEMGHAVDIQRSGYTHF